LSADHDKLFEVAKSALGHAVGSLVPRAYARIDLLDQRRAMMDAWARFLIPVEAGDPDPGGRVDRLTAGLWRGLRALGRSWVAQGPGAVLRPRSLA
jgi:hypothetical protein